MSQIRPVSDLRNNFADIARTVHETGEHVIFAKNGYRCKRSHHAGAPSGASFLPS